ncbi:MAG TPA: alkaline phosphatase family protein [Stellaceae bacterium]|nr:alkaline phosphatase family protein [Stellaceae bacterium]
MPTATNPGAVATALAALLLASCAATPSEHGVTAARTATPIEHLVVVVGENLSFDNLFATFRPALGQSVANLLSKGIVLADGSPGPDVALAMQRQAAPRQRYEVTPPIAGRFAVLPQPNTTYAHDLPPYSADARFPRELPNAPFQITRYADYAAYVGDPVHRFFQMWQQFDGGRNDLFVWTGVTSGESAKRGDPAAGTNQGGVAMGFYNMAAGDAPYLRQLAERYALADNYHQPIMGGTGANYFALATGDVAPYLRDGKPAAPPGNQIENPEPLPGTPNWYTQSGYDSGSYVACADARQPGVKAIRDYLASLPYRVFNDGNCAPGTYYLVNNYRPGYFADGKARPLGPDKFVLPPQTTPTIAEALAARGVSWRWYSGGRTAGGVDRKQYCEICDALVNSTAVMTGPLKQNLRPLAELDGDLAAGALPPVAFIVPPNADSGHPAYSTVARYESFVRDLVAKVEARPDVWAKTAILITTDEGGGYYDSGYIQILDFFGDGPRIAMIAVSPFAKPGHVEHTYYDHVSILKFIERNWHLRPLSPRSRDNLPNPVMSKADPYMPENRPAIGDLMELFQFAGDDR